MNNYSVTKFKIIGVGGAGLNIINDMIESDLRNVEFIALSTDEKELNRSLTENRILLNKGQGTDGDSEKGRSSVEDSKGKIKEVLKNTDMLFIVAGMGGGTGTGVAPIIAKIAKEMGIRTIAIATEPFEFEDSLKKNNAEIGIENLKKYVNTLIIIHNEKLFELPNKSITLKNVFKEASNVIRMGIKGILDFIIKEECVNLDFDDIKTVMEYSGIAMLVSVEKTGNEKEKIQK